MDLTILILETLKNETGREDFSFSDGSAQKVKAICNSNDPLERGKFEIDREYFLSKLEELINKYLDERIVKKGAS